MLKKILPFLFLLFCFLLIPPGFYILNSQPITINQDKVAYNLPYPGVLPDHPLFFLKTIRDKFMEWTTRDNIKKAELFLLFSDKRVAMTQELIKKGKDKQALDIFLQGEQYFQKIPKILETSEKQGVSPSADLIQRLRLSNAKHKEVAETLLKNLPQGESAEINQILDLNKQINKELEKL